MEKVRKRTADASLEELLTAAYKKDMPLVWDRYEKLVPLCGFGRLNLCCSLCTQGPCYINPFKETDNATTCGRTRAELVALNFMRLIADGTASILGYCGDSATKSSIVAEKVSAQNLLPRSATEELLSATNMYVEGVAEAKESFEETVRLALAGYNALSSNKEKRAVNEVEAGLGALKTDKPNLLLVGALPASDVAALKLEAKGVNLAGMCGAEHDLNIAGNYGGEEALLFSGLCDAVLVGKACVSPGFLNTAKSLDIPIFYAKDGQFKEAIDAAAANYAKGRNVLPKLQLKAEQASVGYNPSLLEEIKPGRIDALNAKYPIAGCVILGGCSNVKTTHDQSVVELAKELVKNNYLVLATGCAAAALAKVGMMDAEKANHFAGQELIDYLGALAAAMGKGRLPAALHCGTCWQISSAVEIANILKLPLYAAFPEVSLPAAWNSAIAMAALGIPTYVGPVLPIEGTKEATDIFSEILKGKLIFPVEEELTPILTAKKVVASLTGKKEG